MRLRMLPAHWLCWTGLSLSAGCVCCEPPAEVWNHCPPGHVHTAPAMSALPPPHIDTYAWYEAGYYGSPVWQQSGMQPPGMAYSPHAHGAPEMSSVSEPAWESPATEPVPPSRMAAQPRLMPPSRSAYSNSLPEAPTEIAPVMVPEAEELPPPLDGPSLQLQSYQTLGVRPTSRRR